MAVKHFCDGCDREPDRPVDLTKVTVSFGEHQNNPVSFDLCGSCLRSFKDRFPTQWPRTKPSRQNAA